MKIQDRVAVVALLVVIWTILFMLYNPANKFEGEIVSSNINTVDLPVEAMKFDEPLPDVVLTALKNKVQVYGEFIQNGQKIDFVAGTGYIFSDGVVLSAGHVLILGIINLQKERLLTFYVGKNGIPSSTYYEYNFFAKSFDDSVQIYNTEIIALGKWGTLQDFMALRINGSVEYNDPVLTDTFIEGEKVYVSGFSPTNNYVPGTNGTYRSVPIDLIEYTYTDYISAIIQNDNLARYGIKSLIRLRGTVNKGFSGGLAFNERGEVVGMTVIMKDNFVYLLSAVDIELFMKRVRSIL